MDNLFTEYNTTGYKNSELMSLNAEWDMIVCQHGLIENTDEYDIRAKQFSDEISKRTPKNWHV